MKRKIYKIILVFLLTAFSVSFCFAALPPEIKNSKIKAIATVKNIKTTSVSESSLRVTKHIIFKLEKSIENTVVPKEFLGYCESVRDDVGVVPENDLCFPKENENVFVTITNNGGKITSYTISSSKLEKQIINNFDKMKYEFGRIYYEE